MWVFVENIEFVGKHGVFEEERRDGRTFRVDLSVELPTWATDDDLEKTLDYGRLADIVLEVGQGDSVELIETLAYRMMSRVYDTFEAVAAVRMTIRKKAPDVAGAPEWVGASFDVSRARWQALHQRS